MCIIDRLLRDKGSVWDVIAFKQLHVQLVADLPLLIFGHLLADDADLCAGRIFLRGDKPALADRGAAKVKGRDGAEVVGGDDAVGVLLDVDVLPEILEVGFQLWVVLHILPALNWERCVAGFVLHSLSASVIGQPEILVVLCWCRESKIVVNSVSRIHQGAVLGPQPGAMGLENRDILHIGVEDQAVGVVGLVEGFDVLRVRFPLLWLKSQVGIVQGIGIGKAAGSVVEDLQTERQCLRMIDVVWMILQLERLLCPNLKADDVVALHIPCRGFCAIARHLRSVPHDWTRLDVGAVLAAQVIAFHRVALEDGGDVVPLYPHGLIADVGVAVAFHQLSVSVHLAVQLGDGQGGESVLRELQIAGAVVIQVHACDKKGRCNQQKPEINNCLFAAF